MAPSLVLLLLVMATLAGLAALFVLRGRRERSALAWLSATWGQPRERHRDMAGIGLYARLTGRDGPGTVDERTWRDLDLDAVFAHVDRTASVVGQQILCARLRAPPRDVAARETLEALVQRFTADRGLREKAHLALSPLADVEASTLPLLFLGEESHVPWRRLPPLLTAATIVCLGAMLYHPALLIAVLVCFALNVAIRFRLWHRMSSSLPSVRELDALLAAGRKLAAPELSAVRAMTEGLRSTLLRLDRLSPAVSWLATDKTSSLNEVAKVVLEYLNVFLLFDINAFLLALAFLRRNRGAVRELYEAIGLIDVALSTASLRSGSAFARPEIVDAGPVVIEQLVHPLVSSAVPSSLSLAERGLFITGSNMSGKSTFLKAVGVSVILAQALGTTFVERYRAPFLTVRTLIVGADSITEGKSYYLAEVLAALDRLNAVSEEGKHLVLVDELFRGTNTEERIGAGKAYLESLVRRGALTIAASHDRELGSLLAETFEPKHFTERVEGREVVFDYTLRDGVCPTRNAIRILELAGFSSEIVGEAQRVALRLAGGRG
jgi:hypothetical protein